MAHTCNLRLTVLRLALLLVLLSSAVSIAECKKGHPKERHHGSDRIGRNKSLAIAITKRTTHALPHTPRLEDGVKLTTLFSTHDYLSSLLPPQSTSTRSASSPPHTASRTLSIQPSHFHAVYKNASLHSPNASASDQQPHAHSADDETEVVLTDSYHVMYTAAVSIGTPPQHFNMILDTGSSCLWAISATPQPQQQQPTSSEYTAQHPHYLHYYDHTHSTTYQPDGRTWEIQYGVGACTGFLSRDAVTLATLTSSNQTFAEATHLSTNFLNPQQPLDGIVGMSFAGGACKDHTTFIESLYNEGVIARRIFSFHLDTREGKDEENVLVIGDAEEGIGGGSSGGSEERVVYTDVLHAPKREPAMWFVHLEEMSIVYAQGTAPPHAHNDSLRIEHEQDEGEDEADSAGTRSHHSKRSSSRRSHDRNAANEADASEEQDVFRLRERREASRRLRSFLAQHHTDDDKLSTLAAQSLSFCGPTTGPCIALPDTGTSFLTLPTRLFILLVSLITHGRDDCVIDPLSNLFCLGDIDTLPSLAFTFSGERFLLSPADYVLPNRQLAVQVLDFGVDSLNIVILGDVFLRRVRVVFDEEAWRVGFVKRKGAEGSEGQWVGGGGMGGMDDVVGVSLLGVLLVLLLMSCVCLVCACVMCDWWLRRRRSSEYQPIPQHV